MSRNGSMHYAQYQNSERLQRLLEFVLDGEQHTTRDIILGAQICAVNSAADELRENGFQLVCIKRSNPSVYQLQDVEGARIRAAELMAKKEAA